jgi:hypothetical protein
MRIVFWRYNIAKHTCIIVIKHKCQFSCHVSFFVLECGSFYCCIMGFIWRALPQLIKMFIFFYLGVWFAFFTVYHGIYKFCIVYISWWHWHQYHPNHVLNNTRRALPQLIKIGIENIFNWLGSDGYLINRSFDCNQFVFISFKKNNKLGGIFTFEFNFTLICQ